MAKEDGQRWPVVIPLLGEAVSQPAHPLKERANRAVEAFDVAGANLRPLGPANSIRRRKNKPGSHVQQLPGLSS